MNPSASHLLPQHPALATAAHGAHARVHAVTHRSQRTCRRGAKIPGWSGLAPTDLTLVIQPRRRGSRAVAAWRAPRPAQSAALHATARARDAGEHAD